MNKIVITVDTENPQTPLYQKKYSDNRFWANGWGLEKIVEIFSKYNVPAVFFVNVYEYVVWGRNEMKKVLRFLSDNGHDVQLHTHPIWIDDKRREFMFQFSLDEQKNIIRWGKHFIEDTIGKQVTAHRAGGYGVNEDTFMALREENIFFDYSIFSGNKNCRLIADNDTICNKYGIHEIPVESFFFDNKITKLDLDWMSPEQVEKIIKGKHIKNEYANFMLHSYSFQSPIDYFKNMTPDSSKVTKLKDVIRILLDYNFSIVQPHNKN